MSQLPKAHHLISIEIYGNIFTGFTVCNKQDQKKWYKNIEISIKSHKIKVGGHTKE